jgi:RHS repeat-associated protein
MVDFSHALFLSSVARRTDSINPLGQLTKTGYDNASRAKTITDALNQVVTFDYDAASNRNKLTNALNKTWNWTHTPVNLVDTLTTPLGRITDYGYNTRELLSSIAEPSGQTTTITYKDDRQLDTSVDPVGTVAFAYDGKGRIDTVTQGAAVIDRNFDVLNRLTQFTDSAGNVLKYSYDGAGNLRVLTYPDNKTVTYAYDSADRLDSVTDWASRVTDFQYNTSSQLAAIVFPNGTQRVFTYDSAGRLSTMRDEIVSSAAIITKHAFSYDALDRISKEIVTPEPAAFTVSPAIMTYDFDDRLATWNSNACVSDLDGNLTSGPIAGAMATMTYNARNQLTATSGSNASTYIYDAEGRRLSRTTGGVTTTFVTDPNAPLSQLLTSTTSGVTTRYVYAAGILLYQDIAGAIKVHHAGPRGSVTAISDGTATVTDRISYGAYGEIVARTGTTNTPFLYNGLYGVQTDPSGLLYMRARYYSTDTRRFLNSDPIGFAGGNNWFGFVGGSPTNRTDPRGLWYARNPATWFDGQGYEGGGAEFYRWNDVGEASQATLDGIIPFWDPFGDNGGYNKCDKGLQWSRTLGSAARDIYLGAKIPNLTSWVKNPFLYEAGSATVPTRVFEMIEGLSPAWRGRWLSAFGETFAPYGMAEMRAAYEATWNTGLTPLARSVTLALESMTDYLFRASNTSPTNH